MKFLVFLLAAALTSHVGASNCVRLGGSGLNCQWQISSAFSSFVNSQEDAPEHVNGRLAALPTSLSKEDKAGIMQSLLDSDDFEDMDAGDEDEPSSSFTTPSVFASSSSTSITVGKKKDKTRT
jgi:hypothetical protein